MLKNLRSLHKSFKHHLRQSESCHHKRPPESRHHQRTSVLSSQKAVRAPSSPEAVRVPSSPEAVRVPSSPEAVIVQSSPEAVKVPSSPEAVRVPSSPEAIRVLSYSAVKVPSSLLAMRSLISLLTVAAAGLFLLGPARAAVSMSPATEGEQCEFPDGVLGRCEKLTKCLDAKGVIRRDSNIVMCNNNGNSRQLVACCRRPHWIAEKMCLAWAPGWLMETEQGNKTCTTTKPLIHGGEEAGLGELPNMAAVGFGELEKDIKWVCGGSLITPSFVLTAGHCVRADYIWVGLGEHDLSARGGGSATRVNLNMPEGLETDYHAGHPSTFVTIEQRIKVSHSIVHPDYQMYYHDIALLRLQHPAALTQRVLPACLPTRVAARYNSLSVFTAAGWGATDFREQIPGPQSSRKLKKVNIGHIDAIRCNHHFMKQNLVSRPPLGITADILCAGSPGKDTCENDSGGPLMQKAELPHDAGPCQPRMVVGVVSFGPPCKSLGAYTRVSSYIDWITGIVAPKLLPDN